MKVLLLALVVLGALFVIASGVWVALALAAVISAPRPDQGPDPNDQG